MERILKSPVPSRGGVRAGPILALWLSMLLASLGTSSANVALPAIETSFGTSFDLVQWVLLAYLLATTLAVVIAGRIGDLIGRRRMLNGGILLFSAGALFAGAAPTLWLLVAARALQGTGGAIMMVMSMALARDTAKSGNSGSAMGLIGASSATGTALGPSLGGILIAIGGWRAIFLIAGPLGVLAALLVSRHISEEDPRHPDMQQFKLQFDSYSALLLTLSLVTVALSITTANHQLGTPSVVLLSIGASAAVAFVQRQRTVASPLVDLATLSIPSIWSGLAMSAIVSNILMAMLIVGPFYLASPLGLGEAKVGLVLSIGPLAVACIGLPAGRAVDRFGAGAMTALGLAGLLTGATLIALLPTTWGLLSYIPPMLVLTTSYGLFQTANNVAVLAAAGSDRQGAASGLLNLSRNLGLIFGASAMAGVFAKTVGTVHLASATPAAIASGSQATFGVAAAFALLGIGIAISGTVAGSQRSRGCARGAWLRWCG